MTSSINSIEGAESVCLVLKFIVKDRAGNLTDAAHKNLDCLLKKKIFYCFYNIDAHSFNALA
ncbi:hypothetical protein GCM10010919_01510 [Alishewanella longhuensis]|uniref:Uncharacterized protein n=1 Tax=Alishewanella longhuensis TaxID=1091037 RepID=A0ABQ3KWS5_9ALTE|nr:hypothetical protein GCM10010919_01510 [Alishewanella longhuensis]